MKKCKRINKILMSYNLPRYPTQSFPSKIEVEDDIDFISKFIKNDINTLLKE